ncbi:MAG TPA: hypothetical protein VMM38_05340 [Aridibacter sp.]|nr:hypothetical protein [Aridibacter sp.]
MVIFDISGGGFAGGLEWLWLFLPLGYTATVLIEAPILLLFLPRILGWKKRLAAGLWLTSCTYPVVVLVLPALMYGYPRILYLAVAETFAPLAECALFWLVFRGTEGFEAGAWMRSFAVIVVANLLSFGIGEILNTYVWSSIF